MLNQLKNMVFENFMNLFMRFIKLDTVNNAILYRKSSWGFTSHEFTGNAWIDGILSLGTGLTTHVDSNARLGIRTTTGVGMIAEQFGATTGIRWIGRHANGTASSPTQVVNSNTLMSAQGRGYHSGNGWHSISSAGFTAEATEDFTSTACGGQFIIRTVLNGSSSSSNPVARFANDKKTYFYGNTNPQTNNLYDLGEASLAWQDIVLINAPTVLSDQSKKIFENSNVGLDFILGLANKAVKKFKWKTDVIPEQTETIDGVVNIIKPETTINGVRWHQGMIAQKVKEVMDDNNLTDLDFAGWCLNSETNLQLLRLEEFIAPIIKSISELNTKIESLDNRITELESN